MGGSGVGFDPGGGSRGIQRVVLESVPCPSISLTGYASDQIPTALNTHEVEEEVRHRWQPSLGQPALLF
jgi:hypothetical protein